VSHVTLPDGNAVTYDYSTDSQPLLTAVHYSDGTNRGYGYTSARLSSVTDENGSAYVNVTYNSNGKATASQLAGGVNRYRYTPAYTSGGPLVYGNEGATGTFALTTPLGETISFTTINVKGSIRSATMSLSCPTCGETSAALAYDSNGNVSSRTDFKNKKVCYAYDLSRNLETARAEGILSTETCSTALVTLPARADVRKVSAQWHAVWRQPTRVAEPNRLTTNAYNGDGGVYCAPSTALVNGNPIGVLCTKTVQETTDATGQRGFAAALTGTPRVWQYTYDSFGRVLTATDPNHKTTTTVYYAANDPDLGKRGNVRTINNPLGHVTSFMAYDANGQPLSITDPNGTVATLTYHPRGWLTSRSVGGEQTTYTYDGVGQLTKVTLPDGSYVQYTYDGAHRLTQIQDGLGNKIVYTLDAMGNRIMEQAYDPSGQLARGRQQVFDSLNRLHQSVGAQ
jgi:YD repeat-containing protein